MKKLVLLAAYLSTMPLFLFALIMYSLSLVHGGVNAYNKSVDLITRKVDYRALPQNREEVSVRLNSQEARVTVLKEFFSRYNSPLLPFAEEIVKAADQHLLDYRLLPAIAMQESTLCKKIPKESYNCWGFGIYSGKVTRFSSYSEAIETISKVLSQDYKGNGLVEPSEIMTKYTPGSNGSWAKNVSFIMDKIASTL